MNWDGVDRRDRQRWALRKEVSVGDLIAFCVAAVAIVSAYTTLDKRISRLEDLTALQEKIDRRQDEENYRQSVRVEETLRLLMTKIDRLMETRK